MVESLKKDKERYAHDTEEIQNEAQAKVARDQAAGVAPGGVSPETLAEMVELVLVIILFFVGVPGMAASLFDIRHSPIGAPSAARSITASRRRRRRPC